MKMSSLIFLSILMLPLSGFSSGEMCSSVFSQNTPSLHLSWDEAKSFRHDLFKAMTSKQRIDRFPLIQQSLQNMQHSLVEELANTADDSPFRKPIEVALQKLNQGLKTGLTYKAYSNLSLSYVDAITNGYFTIVKELYANTTSNFRGTIVVPPVSKAEDVVLYLPLMKDLDLDEINAMWSLGILPIGIVDHPTDADGFMSDTFQFWQHDNGHNGLLIERLTRQLKHPPTVSDFAKIAWFYEKMQSALMNSSASPQARYAFEYLFFDRLHESYQNVTNVHDLLGLFTETLELSPEKKHELATRIFTYLDLRVSKKYNLRLTHIEELLQILQ